MDLNLSEVTILHNEEAHRFEAEIAGLRAFLDYRRYPDRILFTHTEVPPLLEGKGLAAKLARTAFDFARANHLRVLPVCPYAAVYILKHAEYHDLVSAGDLQKLTSRSSATTGK